MHAELAHRKRPTLQAGADNHPLHRSWLRPVQDSEFDGTAFLADRSIGKVTAITSMFAIGGSLMMLAEMFIPSGMPMLWGLWIPLCFLLIPSVHSLARENRLLRKRLDAIESTLASQIPNVE